MLFKLSLEPYSEEGVYSFSVAGISLLLVKALGRYHVLESKCGHFGVSLDQAFLKNGNIVCPEHGISFDLDTGKVVNRPFENCSPLKVYESRVQDSELSFEMEML